MCLKTAPLTKPSASELPFPSVAPTLCQDAGRSYSLSAYPGQCHCEQCLQQKGKKRGRWPNLSFHFHFHQMLGSVQPIRQSHNHHSARATQQKDPSPLDPPIKWPSPAQVSFSPTQCSSCMLTEPTDPSILFMPSSCSLTMLTPPLQESANASQHLYYSPVTCEFDTK